MTVVAAVIFRVVLLYQGWSHWVFRARLNTAADNIDGASSASRH